MSSKLEKIYLYIRAIPKTIYFNFKYFNFKQAIRFPVIVSHKTWLLSARGSVHIDSTYIKPGFIKIGFGEVGIFDRKNSRSIWQVEGNVIFKGKCFIGHGSKICVGANGLLRLGDNFMITAESSILCHKNIDIGSDCLLSWDILVMDTDFHKIKNIKGETINEDKSISVGNKVWIGCRSLILKGSKIADGCVIAANTIISKNYSEERNILGGNPVRILRENIEWEL